MGLGFYVNILRLKLRLVIIRGVVRNFYLKVIIDIKLVWLRGRNIEKVLFFKFKGFSKI